MAWTTQDKGHNAMQIISRKAVRSWSRPCAVYTEKSGKHRWIYHKVCRMWPSSIPSNIMDLIPLYQAAAIERGRGCRVCTDILSKYIKRYGQK